MGLEENGGARIKVKNPSGKRCFVALKNMDIRGKSTPNILIWIIIILIVNIIILILISRNILFWT